MGIQCYPQELMWDDMLKETETNRNGKFVHAYIPANNKHD